MCDKCLIPDITMCPIHDAADGRGIPTSKCQFSKMADDVFRIGKIMGEHKGADDIGVLLLKVYQAGRRAGTLGPKGGL